MHLITCTRVCKASQPGVCRAHSHIPNIWASCGADPSFAKLPETTAASLLMLSMNDVQRDAKKQLLVLKQVTAFVYDHISKLMKQEPIKGCTDKNTAHAA